MLFNVYMLSIVSVMLVLPKQFMCITNTIFDIGTSHKKKLPRLLVNVTCYEYLHVY